MTNRFPKQLLVIVALSISQIASPALFTLLLSPAPAYGQIPDPTCTTTGLSITIEAHIGGSSPSDPVAIMAYHGDVIYYNVTEVSLPSSTDCPIIRGVVNVITPDGEVHTVATGLALGPPDPYRSKIINATIPYTAAHTDEVDTPPRWRAAATIDATRIMADGTETPVQAFQTRSTLALHPTIIPVFVDLKPGSWPNPLNVKSKGVFALAICGTEEFDVTTIDPATVKVHSEDVEEGVSPLRWSYEDVCTPYAGELGGGHALNGDGILDLVFHFDTQTVAGTVTLTHHVGETVPLIVTGNIYREQDGTPIKGQDYARILGT